MTASKKKGMFIVLEGIDGSGTTTQGKLLMERFTEEGIPAWFTFEPTEGPVGRLIRQMLRKEIEIKSWLAEAMLFAADRIEHAEIITEKLSQGIHVVSDRYDLSNRTYQMESRPEQMERYPFFTRSAHIDDLNSTLPRPDLTIALDISANVAEARRNDRDQVIELFETPVLQRKVAARYAWAETLVRDYLVHVDAQQAPETVHEEIWKAYEHRCWLERIREEGRRA